MNLEEITRKLGTQMAAMEDSAVAAFVRAQCDQITMRGENLAEYEMVRVTDPMQGLNEIADKDGIKLTVNVSYRLRKMKADPINHRALRDCGMTTAECLERGYCEGHYL